MGRLGVTPFRPGQIVKVWGDPRNIVPEWCDLSPQDVHLDGAGLIAEVYAGVAAEAAALEWDWPWPGVSIEVHPSSWPFLHAEMP